MSMMNLLTGIWILGLMVGFASGTSENINAHEYHVLCRLYQIAKKDIPEPDADVLKEGMKLAKAITSLQIMAANDSYYGQASTTVTDDVKEKVRRLPEGRVRAGLERRLRRLEESAKRALGELQTTLEAMRANVKEGNKLLIEAVYGTGAVQRKAEKEKVFGAGLDAETGPNRCGGNGSGNGSNGKHTGMSLIHDVICLCFPISGASNEVKACLTAGLSGQHSDWAATHLTNAITAWDTLSRNCPQTTLGPTVDGIELALQSFHNALGRQAKEHASDGRFLLGKSLGSGNNECDGSSEKVCVNYKAQLTGTGIPWETKMRDAQKELRSIEDAKKKVNRILQKLDALNETAWHDYGAARDTQELSFNDDKQPGTNKSGLSEAGFSKSKTTVSGDERQFVSSAIGLSTAFPRILNIIRVILV